MDIHSNYSAVSGQSSWWVTRGGLTELLGISLVISEGVYMQTASSPFYGDADRHEDAPRVRDRGEGVEEVRVQHGVGPARGEANRWRMEERK